MPFDPTRPYNDLPMLPPKADLESPTIMRRCAEARAAVAALQQATDLIPNPAILVNSIPILEARGSSEIENIVTSTEQMLQWSRLDREPADPATKEALRYHDALMEGIDAIRERPVATTTAVTICTRIKDVTMEVRKVPGTQLVNSTTKEVIYTPPVGQDRLLGLLSNWERFLHESEMDPLVRMAASHYQFEAIHPFTDGNGRTGRILNILFLVGEGVLTLPVLYLSRHFLRYRTEYYRGLRGVTQDRAWEPWMLYMLDAVVETSEWTRRKINAIRELIAETVELVREKEPKIYTHELVDVLFERPFVRIGDLVDAGIAKRETASDYLRRLTAIGVLTGFTIGRDKLFRNVALFNLLTGEEWER